MTYSNLNLHVGAVVTGPTLLWLINTSLNSCMIFRESAFMFAALSGWLWASHCLDKK